MFYYSFFDWTLILLLPVLIFSFIAQFRVKRAFEWGSKTKTACGITGAQTARRILDENGLYHISVQRTPGQLTDHYSPKEGTIYLSEEVYDSTSAAAVGVAAHEAGHAVQYAKDYFPIRIRTAIIPLTRVGSALAMPLFIIGMLFAGGSYLGGNIGTILMLAGILFFSFSTLFQLVTLPTEFNASSRAMKALEDGGILTSDELPAAKSTLTAAAMTYVAALASSLASLLRLILIFNRRR